MKEFIEKLIGRLEEKQNDVVGNTSLHHLYVDGFSIGIEVAIEIVKELAEENNGGWISVEERLPSFDGAFICTAKEVEESLELIYSSFDNSWMDEFDSEYEVIAWQPLPPAFKLKGE